MSEAKHNKPSGVISIHGREYQTVAYRVQNFREANPLWALVTDIVSRDAECVVMRATISDETGRLLATGHAEEYRTASQINRTSALENAETSAIGRALAALGYGGTEFATANEVQNAIHQQGASPNGPITPTSGAWDAMTPDWQSYLEEVATSVRARLEEGNPAGALEEITLANLDADQKVALWTRFNSKERRAMKDVQTQPGPERPGHASSGRRK